MFANITTLLHTAVKLIEMFNSIPPEVMGLNLLLITLQFISLTAKQRSQGDIPSWIASRPLQTVQPDNTLVRPSWLQRKLSLLLLQSDMRIYSSWESQLSHPFKFMNACRGSREKWLVCSPHWLSLGFLGMKKHSVTVTADRMRLLVLWCMDSWALAETGGAFQKLLQRT